MTRDDGWMDRWMIGKKKGVRSHNRNNMRYKIGPDKRS